MSLFKGKYRNESARKQGHDYSDPGLYFITINCHDRIKLLGNIYDGIMELSEIGKIVEEEWLKSFKMRDQMSCEEWMLMPEHIHAIVKIQIENYNDQPDNHKEVTNYGVAYRSPKSISSLVAGFKSVATKRINDLRQTPGKTVWQSRYHDHIIRNNEEYERIKQYIIHNPINYKG